ncbi:hypothetical protein B0H34DRAFT_684398 [Crassisporium funariophilum]|nr:hypothetical protein B0H34DRAFT_684398 [Crassisporium funariophilum]
MDPTRPSTSNSSLLFRVDTPRSSPSKSPRRLHTVPDEYTSDDLKMKVFKRLIVCCDGTWQDGISEHRSAYTNVLRLARTINHVDERFQPSIPQIVFYQSGIGTEKNFYSEYVEGTTGGSLADKVEEAYAFIAHNYNPGDEIFLFGFSRGAYTARMVATFIGEIGVLDRRDMDHFGSIFINYQNLGNCENAEEENMLKEKLAPWCKADAAGRKRADCDNDKFTVKCLGVWDTVGSLGLPEEIPLLRPKKAYKLFGFHDRLLGGHIERAYQALALNETRNDFTCNKFQQSESGRRRKQVLKQTWFTGCHTDVGGGYKNHDLADISLIWMAAHIGDALSLDLEYMSNLFEPVAPWGTQKPHDSATGIFILANTGQRPLPTMPNDPITHESIHPSVLQQQSLYPALSELLKKHPKIVCNLSPMEEEMKMKWRYDPESEAAKAYALKLKTQSETIAGGFAQDIISRASSIRRSLLRTVSRKKTLVTTETSTVVIERQWTVDLSQRLP